MIPGSSNPLMMAAAPAGGYQVSRSLRFNRSDSGFCSRTPAVAGSRTTWTWAAWVKRSNLGAVYRNILSAANSSNDRYEVYFTPSDELVGEIRIGGTGYIITTTPIYRDPSAWYHLVVVMDTTQATAADRHKIYINGTQVTSFSSASYPPQNSTPQFNAADPHSIGRYQNGAAQYFDGYLADIHFIDGQALTPSSFTEVSATTGQLIPKTYTGTYGTNGFQLKFADNSSNTATTLGKDTSGNSNNWTPNNLSTSTGGPTSVAAASGALPVYNTTDTYGTTKGSGTRTDSNSSSIVLAIPMDGTNNGTTFTDESATIKGSGSAKSITNSNVTTSTAQSKYYGSSGLFNSTSDKLTVPTGGSGGDLDFGSGSFTIECWVYANSINSNSAHIVSCWVDPSPLSFQFAMGGGGAQNKFAFGGTFGGSQVTATDSTASSAGRWYHVAGVRDGNTLRLFVDGIQAATASCSGAITTPPSDVTIGQMSNNSSANWDGYISDLRIYKGAAKYTGNFNPPSSTANATIAAGNDSLVDTPTSYGTDTGVGGEVRGNYATLNPLTRNSIYSLPSLSNGNLDAVASSSGSFATATFGVSNGKYYWEFTAGSNVSSGSTSRPASGFNSSNDVNSTSFAYRQNGATVGLTGSPTFATYQTGDTIGIALNVDSTEVSFYKNGSLQGSGAYTYSNTANIVFPGIFSADNNGSYSYNFGQRAFAYTAPSGFKALCDTNLPAPLVAKPNTLMDVALYTGNGSTQTISGLAFSPDLVWIKRRDSAANHALFDVVRGTGKFLESSSTNAEATSANSLTAFNSDGFSLGTYSQTNTNSATYATWAWDAGTSTVSNTAGSITSQVRANVSAGFSVVTYTGTGSAATVGHGLGVAPSLVLVKIRSQTGNWQGYHASLGKNYTIKLNTTDAQENIADYWGAGGVTSSVVGLIGGGYSTNVNGATHVAYCFAPVVGYSSFGSYTGNGSADGPFVYTGFRPRWIMIKNSSATANWLISDSARDPSNLVKNVLLPNLSNAEDTAADYVDFVSNGFKIKTAPSAAYNANGNTYVFVAFAENPFQYARAR